MRNGSDDRWGRTAAGVALLAALFCLVLMGLRFHGAISFSEPLQVVTSGWEQESLIAIWEAQHDRPVYVSRWEFPYRWAVYNWLYYDAYAAGSRFFSIILSLDAFWLPTLTRMLSVFGMIVGAFAAYWVFTATDDTASGQDKPLIWAFSIFVAAGPLIGYWGLTTRPDVWALTLEVLAIAAFWSLTRSQRMSAILAFCVLAYAAWAFKQTAVVAVGALGALLLFRKRWAELAVLVAVMVGSWAGTLALGSDIYTKSILVLEYTSIWSLSHALSLFVNFITKSVPALLGLAAIGFIVLRFGGSWRRLWCDDVLVLAVSGTAIGVMFGFTISMQPGATENYYFTPMFFAALAVLSAMRLFREGEIDLGGRSILLGSQTFGWGLQALAVGLVLIGVTGSTSVRNLHDSLLARKACLDELPRPLFVNDHYLSLPWMTPGNPPFVLAYGYHADRLAGRKYARNGIGGLISEGYFAAVALGHDPRGTFDGGSMAHYQPVDQTCAELWIFEHR